MMPRDIDGLTDEIDQLVDWQLTLREGAAQRLCEIIIPADVTPWSLFDPDGNIDHTRLANEGWVWV
jgi:hypothetical protein